MSTASISWSTADNRSCCEFYMGASAGASAVVAAVMSRQLFDCTSDDVEGTRSIIEITCYGRVGGLVAEKQPTRIADESMAAGATSLHRAPNIARLYVRSAPENFRPGRGPSYEHPPMISAASLEVLILILWSLRQIAHQAHAVARIPTGLSARFLLRRPNRRLRGAGLQTGATSDVESRVAQRLSN